MLAPYPQLARAGFRRYAAYRQAALAGLTTNLVFGLLRAAVLVAVLAQRGTVAGCPWCCWRSAGSRSSAARAGWWCRVAELPARGPIYTRIIASRIRSQLAYPGSFALDVTAQLIGQAVEFVAILVLFTQVTSLGGFGRDEVVLMYGLAATAFGIADLTVGQVEQLSEYIRTGEFDVMLLRPLGSLPQLLSADIALKRVGRVLVGGGVLVWSLAALPIDWTPGRVLVAVLAPVTGAAILAALWVAANTVSFWLVDGREVANTVTYGSNFATSYPITIYGPWLRRFMCFAVPGAFVAYFPALALLDRPDPLGLPDALRYSSPVVAAAAVGMAALVWRLGVRHYQGTGS